MEGLIFKFIPKNIQKSEYDWVNIIFKEVNVGKARCLIDGDIITIFSVNIYPEYQGKGYGRAFIDYLKKNYSTIIADRVRNQAIEFWNTVGFIPDDQSENWTYQKHSTNSIISNVRTDTRTLLYDQD